MHSPGGDGQCRRERDVHLRGPDVRLGQLPGRRRAARADGGTRQDLRGARALPAAGQGRPGHRPLEGKPVNIEVQELLGQ